MMRLLWLGVKLAVLVGATLWLAELDSDVTLEILGYEITTSLAVVFVGAVLVFMILGGVARLVRQVQRLPARLQQQREDSRLRRGLDSFSEGLVALAAGDGEAARKQAEKAQDLLPHHTGLGMLLTAWTAQQQGDDTAARQLFSQLASGKQNLSFLGLRGLISDALRHGKLERGLDLVKQAGERQPKTPWVLFTRLNLEARLNRWADAEDVIKAMQKKKLLDSATVGRLNAIIALQLSRQLKRDGHGSDALNYAREAFRLDNGFAPATLHYAHMIAEDGRLRRAAGILQKGWKAAPHPALGSAYIKLFADRSATDALKKVKALVRSNPEHPESLYLLARMQVRAKEYEAARATLLPLLEDETATRKVFQTMADIEEADNQGWQTVRQWMTKAEEAPLDATWVCNSCQQVCEDWQPLCPTCHSFGTLLWQRPGAQHLPALQMPNSPLDLSPEPFLPGRKAG